MLFSKWDKEFTYHVFKFLILIQSLKHIVFSGVMSCPGKRLGNSLPQETVDKVINFYNSDGISRTMPGKSDFISFRNDKGEKVQAQKRLLLLTCSEAHEKFQDENGDIEISISKFYELRPPNVILLGSSGSHNVCVCTYHQNVLLMLENSSLIKDNPLQLPDKSFKGYLKLLVCDESTENCHLDRCSKCQEKDFQPYKNLIINSFSEKEIYSIHFQQWVNTDRSNLVTYNLPVEEFVDKLFYELKILKTHDYISIAQGKYLKEKIQSLDENELIVGGDFSENYRFLVQDCSQSFHWNTDSATLHPFIVYSKENGESKPECFAIISDEMSHKTFTVAAFQSRLIEHLKQKYPNLKKIIYFSDGSGEQYKNRFNFINLAHHKEDHNIEAEWHFYATAHGKGACDGIGGTIKRNCAKYSMGQLYDNQINSAEKFFDWANKSLKHIKVFFVKKQDVELKKIELTDRFNLAKQISGTRKFHSYKPHPQHASKLIVKRTSNDTIEEEKSIM